MKRLIGGVAVAVAVAAGATAVDDNTTRNDAGEIIEGGGLGVQAMQVGDCLIDVDEEYVESMQAVPCSEPHDLEVLATVTLSGGDAYPGESEVAQQAYDRCVEVFDAYVGTPFLESTIDVAPLYPIEEGWEDWDDREANCLLFTMDGSQLTRSVRNSGL